MKNTRTFSFLFIFFLLALSHQLSANQLISSCGDEVFLTTQAEVDAWVAANPGCTFVISLTISGGTPNDINDLSGLSSIQSVDAPIKILNTAILTNLNGLQNITFGEISIEVVNNQGLLNIDGLSGIAEVGSVTIKDNPALLNINGLAGLNMVFGNITIENNPMLNSLTGLANISSNFLGNFELINNDGLLSLNGMQGLMAPSGTMKISGNDGLTDLVGMGNAQASLGMEISDNANITSLNGWQVMPASTEYLTISGNNLLLNLDGLENFGTILFSLSITDNQSLNNIDAIANIQAGTNSSVLEIKNNPSLSMCSIFSICDWIANGVIGNLIIEQNASGCQSVAAVQNICNGTGCAGVVACTDDLIATVQGLSFSSAVEHILTTTLLMGKDRFGRSYNPEAIVSFNLFKSLVDSYVTNAANATLLKDEVDAIIALIM